MTATLLVVLAAVVVAGAVRSTWSPCGVSMLSTITPLGEQGRGRRFGATAAWFVAGALLGGLCLGALVAGAAAGVGAAHWSATTRAVLGALACTVAACSDVRLGGFALPTHGRQVNERWLDRYRPWVYGGGFGWQIGSGVATFITTGCVYLVVVLGALTGRPVAAVAAGASFGLVRGLAVLLGRGAVDPGSLRSLHERMARLEPLSRMVAAATAVAGAGVLWLAAWWPAAVVLAGAGAGAALARQSRSRRVAEPVGR